MSLMNRHKRIPFAGNRRQYNQHNQGIRIIFGHSQPQSLGHSFGTQSSFPGSCLGTNWSFGSAGDSEAEPRRYSSSSTWPLNLAITSC